MAFLAKSNDSLKDILLQQECFWPTKVDSTLRKPLLLLFEKKEVYVSKNHLRARGDSEQSLEGIRKKVV